MKRTKTHFSQLIMVLILVFTCILPEGCSKKPEDQGTLPNLLFVFTDQQSYDMLGVAGNGQVITPHLDKLAEEGILFRHSVSNSPLCTPMRAMLMTGQHPLYNGCWANDLPLLPDKGVTFAQSLNGAGYETAYVGKWHLYGGETRNTGISPGPNRHGFDGTFLTNNVTVDFRPQSCFYWNDDNEKVFFKDVYEDQPWELEGQTRQAEAWLKEYQGDKPFGLFVSWHPPHDYIGDACPEVEGRQYNYDVGPLDPSLIDPYKEMDIILRPDLLDDPDMVPCRMEQYRNYMAMVTACDDAVGRLIQILKEKGALENTLIVFTSDHGDMIGSHDASSPKSRPHDYSVRVPLIMSWPDGLGRSGESDLLVGSMDLMPTILGMMGLEVPGSVQGLDLSEAIREGNDEAVESVPLFYYPGGSWKGVYTRDWTYSRAADPVQEGGSGAEINVLFDRRDDPGQLNNLFNNTAYADIKQNLDGLTQKWMEKFGDKGYSQAELSDIMDREHWRNNYTTRPIDLLNQKSAESAE